MVVDPRVTELFEYAAVKIGAIDRAKEEQARQIASNLLRDGIDPKIVAKSTGLDIADVVMIASAQA